MTRRADIVSALRENPTAFAGRHDRIEKLLSED